MSSAVPPDPGPSLPASQADALLKAFTDFLTLALHSLLYHRRLYPPHTFLAVRAFNIAAHQSRHPGVCAWVGDAVAAVTAQLRRGAVERAALAVHGPGQKLEVLERWVFDVGEFPVWGPEATRELEADEVPADNGNEAVNEEEDELNWSDIYEALRGALRRIAYAAEAIPLPPEGSTFTLAIELRDDALAPIGHPQPWIPSEPHLQPATRSHPRRGASLGGATTKPVRSVQAGPLFFECWVEQGKPPKVTRDVPVQSRASTDTTSQDKGAAS